MRLGGGAHWLCRSPRNGMRLNGGFPEAGAPPPPYRAGQMEHVTKVEWDQLASSAGPPSGNVEN